MRTPLVRVARLAWVVLALALGVTLLLCALLRRSEAHADTVQLQASARLATTEFKNYFEIQTQLLRSGAAFLLAGRSVSSQSWARYAEQLAHQGLPTGVQQIGYAQRTSSTDIGSLVQAMRADGVAQFQVFPKRVAPTHTPVLYLSSGNRNSFVQPGFDLLAVPAIEAALAYATDTGQPALTTLLENNAKISSGPARMLLLVPLFPDGALPASAAQRRNAVGGFIFATLQLDGVCGTGKAGTDIDTRWYASGTAGARSTTEQGVLLCAPPTRAAHTLPSAPLSTPITLYGQHLTLQLRLPTVGATTIPATSTAVALTGTLASFVLFWLVLVKTSASQRLGASHHRSARALRQLETQLSALIELSEQAVLVIDRAQRIMIFNPAAERLFKASAGAAIGTDVSRFLPKGLKHTELIETITLPALKLPVHRVRNRHDLPARREKGDSFSYQAEVFKTGRWGQSCYVVVLQASDNALPSNVTTSDAVSHASTKSLSAVSSTATVRLLDDVAHAAPSSFGHFEISVGDDPREARIEWSSGMFALLGCRPDIGAVLVTRFIETRLHIDDRAAVQTQMDWAFMWGETVDFCYRMQLPDGTQREVRQWMSLARTIGTLRLFVGAIFDHPDGNRRAIAEPIETVSAAQTVASNKAANNSIFQEFGAMPRLRDEGLHRLVDRYDFAREEQQKRLAQEIHDDFGQLLAAMKIDLQVLQVEVGQIDRNLLRKLVGMNDLVDTMVASVRRIMADLPPKLIDEHGLFKAVELLVDSFGKRHRIACTLQLPGDTATVNETIATPLYRVIQEALNNVAKHARASHLTIRIACSTEEITLTIADDGVGIADGAGVQPGSYGLAGMHQRVRALGGTMRVATNSLASFNAGTTIQIAVPLSIREATDC